MPDLSYVSVGGIFIDDIVYPDGRTVMEVLGGGGVHAAMGMRLWDEQPGLVSCAGYDLPDTARVHLEANVDLSGIVWLKSPQARAWQIFEHDGRRRELYRVDDITPYIDRPGVQEVPRAYHHVKAAYLLRDGASLAGWRALYPDACLLWEPLQQYMVRANHDEFVSVLHQVDIVSPNLLEARTLYKTEDPGTLATRMHDDGAKIVALRMGELGSLVSWRDGGILLRIPPVAVPEIVDQTGAGNTYCGAFLVGWVETGNIVMAACYAAVAASFALEGVGVIRLTANYATIRNNRMKILTRQLLNI